MSCACVSGLPATAQQLFEPAEVAEVAHENAERLGEIHVMVAGVAAAQPRFPIPIVGFADNNMSMALTQADSWLLHNLLDGKRTLDSDP